MSEFRIKAILDDRRAKTNFYELNLKNKRITPHSAHEFHKENNDNMTNSSFYRVKHELCFAFHSGVAAYYLEKDMLDNQGRQK